MSERLRHLPAVHVLAEDPSLAALEQAHGREMLIAAARAAIDAARAEILASTAPDRQVADANGRDEAEAVREGLLADLRSQLAEWLEPRPRPVINATGVLLHTNLGRAPVSTEAAEAMRRAAAGYSDLELDLASGKRGSRHDMVTPLLKQLTGAEAALVVNNNAGATMLVLSALAQGQGVLVSRGELVEIGGGYRIPDVMAAGGALLVEVGTTNRTRVGDYRLALEARLEATAEAQASEPLDPEETPEPSIEPPPIALLLRVHTSNYRIIGFTEAPSLEELVALSREFELPLVDDLGSGSLLDTADFGLASEPMVARSLAAGADLATFSGDKLLGGPQAGIIVGRSDLVARLRKHPLTRAMRPDKATLAGLHATLRHYAQGEAQAKVPLWRMMAAGPKELAQRAQAWLDALPHSASEQASGSPALIPGESTVGGGSLPGETLPTTLLAIPSRHPDRLAAALRGAETAVMGRIAENALLLDPRTVLPEQDVALIAALVGAFG